MGLETDELLAMMRKVIKEAVNHKSHERKDVGDCEQQKIAPGARLVDQSTTTSAVVDNVDNKDKKSEAKGEEERVRDVGADGNTPRAKNGRILDHGERFKEEMDRFEALLRQSDEVQRHLKQPKISMDQRRLEAEEPMKEADIAEQRRESNEKRKERAEEGE